MQTGALERLDSFPYRHRVGDLMTSPPLTAHPDMSVLEAARLLTSERVGALLVSAPDQPIAGLFSERDALRLVAEQGAAALARPLSDCMSRSVVTIAADAFLYVAMGRMERWHIRHLVVTGAAGQPVGILSQRAMLRVRAQTALRLGDAIGAAVSGPWLARAWAEVPELARQLLAEGVEALEIAAVIAGATADLTTRAADLAAQELGPAPGRWCVLLLGSAGRGETLLIPDQDNALVYDGGDPDWYARFGARMCSLLDEAGLPFCKGGVMAREPAWRHDLTGWQQQFRRWAQANSGQSLLSVDIFYDFQPVAGDLALGEGLRAPALAAAAGSPSLLRLLAHEIDQRSSPLGMFGGIRDNDGKLDIKLHGLLPLTAAARLTALRHRSPATNSRQRRVLLTEGDRQAQNGAQAVFTDLLLHQQLADLAAGVAPSTNIDTRALSREDRRRLKTALGVVRDLDVRPGGAG